MFFVNCDTLKYVVCAAISTNKIYSIFLFLLKVVDSTQGVGHLPDGTMVVVEGAKQSIGKIIEVEFIRSLQTSAGKMMFAKMSGSAKTSAKPSAKTSTKTNPKANAKTTIKKPANKTPKKKNYRRETPEDRLVELANNN